MANIYLKFKEFQVPKTEELWPILLKLKVKCGDRNYHVPCLIYVIVILVNCFKHYDCSIL